MASESIPQNQDINQTPFVIAVDGANASGKGTISKKIAEHFGFAHLDTGLLYRAIGYRMEKEGLNYNNLHDVLRAAEEPLTEEELANFELKGEIYGQLASIIGIHKELREILDKYQYNFPNGKRGAVVDGRDIGTFIFPNADAKLFVTASLEERAKRRFKELQSQGKSSIYDQVLEDIKSRQERDSTREVNPCVRADDAFLLDTSSLSSLEACNLAIQYINNKINNKLNKTYGKTE